MQLQTCSSGTVQLLLTCQGKRRKRKGIAGRLRHAGHRAGQGRVGAWRNAVTRAGCRAGDRAPPCRLTAGKGAGREAMTWRLIRGWVSCPRSSAARRTGRRSTEDSPVDRREKASKMPRTCIHPTACAGMEPVRRKIFQYGVSGASAWAGGSWCHRMTLASGLQAAPPVAWTCWKAATGACALH